MNISSISSLTGSAAANESELTQLQNERNKLERQLQKINSSQDDAKSKQQQIQQIQLQIQAIDMQIQQIKQKQAEKQELNTSQSQSLNYKNGPNSINNNKADNSNLINIKA